MGTILVVHDELNSLELSVFKKDDRSKPELRYFPVCEIENMDALEVIEIGGMNKTSCNFHYASLELKSILIHSK